MVKLKSVTQADGTSMASQIVYDYDGYGRLQSVTNIADAYTLTYDYDAIGGDPLKTLDRVAKVTYPGYDVGKPEQNVERIEFLHLDPEYIYDRSGRMTHIERDAMRRVRSITDPEQRTTHYDYCTCGALEGITDAANHSTTWIRDLMKRPKEKWINGQKVATYEYEPRTSRLKSITDAKSQVRTFGYYVDNNLKLLDYSDPLTPDVSLVYDHVFDRVETVTSAGEITHFAYVPIGLDGALNALNVSIEASSAPGIPLPNSTIAYSYDELDRLVGRSIGAGATNQLTTSFDALGRSHGFTSSVLGQFGVHFPANPNSPNPGPPLDNIPRPDYLEYPNHQRVNLSYYGNIPDVGDPSLGNSDRRLKQIRNLGVGIDGSGSMISQFVHDFDLTAKIEKWTQSSSADTVGKRFVLGYDDSDWLTDVTIQNPSSGLVSGGASYGYDDAGNRTAKTEGATVSGTFNGANQLTDTAPTGAYAIYGNVDKPSSVKVNGVAATMSSNRLSFKGQANVVAPGNSFTITATEDTAPAGFNPKTRTSQYQVPSAKPAQHFVYDDNGNLTKVQQGGTDVRRYEWDAADRLVAIDLVADNKRSEFAYDAFSRRRRMIEKANGTVVADHLLLWDDLSIAEEHAASTNSVTKRYFGMGFQDVGANTVYFYTKDHLGSIREVTNSSGAVLTRYDYDVWGQRTTTHLNGAVDVDFGFTGHYFHSTSGLCLAPYRGYDASNGRWISRDPIGERGGANLYTYSLNDPANNIDPLGLLSSTEEEEATKALNLARRMTAASPLFPPDGGSAAARYEFGGFIFFDPLTGMYDSVIPHQGDIEKDGGSYKPHCDPFRDKGGQVYGAPSGTVVTATFHSHTTDNNSPSGDDKDYLLRHSDLYSNMYIVGTSGGVNKVTGGYDSLNRPVIVLRPIK